MKSMYKNIVLILAISSIAILSGCSKDDSDQICSIENLKDEDREVIEEYIKQEQQYNTVVEKLMNGEELTSEDKNIVVYYLIADMFASFEDYKNQIDFLYDHTTDIALLISSSMNMLFWEPILKPKGCFQTFTSTENLNWIVNHLTGIEDEVYHMDDDGLEYKINLSSCLNYIYHYLGDTEKEKYYLNLYDQYIDEFD